MHTVHLPFVAAYSAPLPLVLRLINAERVAQGMVPLVMHPGLMQAAQHWADHMRDTGTFGHGDWAERIVAHYPGWRAIGENIAAGFPSAAGAVAAWMDSDGHRANILNSLFEEAGVGYAEGGPFRWYWVLDLGARF